RGSFGYFVYLAEELSKLFTKHMMSSSGNMVNVSGVVLLWAALTFSTTGCNSGQVESYDGGQKPVSERFVHTMPGNPYLPLWEHLPDGEPRVFEDPDNPGKFRAYIIGSHDLRYTSYCGPDIRMWS